MAATAPITELRQAIIALLEAEFPSELAGVKPGRLHPAHPGGWAGVYPIQEAASAAVSITQDTMLAIQVFLPWAKQVDPTRVADPTTLESYAERIRERVFTANHPRVGSAGVWYFRVTRVDYEADPTGQITRFTAYVTAPGQNYAETSA